MSWEARSSKTRRTRRLFVKSRTKSDRSVERGTRKMTSMTYSTSTSQRSLKSLIRTKLPIKSSQARKEAKKPRRRLNLRRSS